MCHTSRIDKEWTTHAKTGLPHFPLTEKGFREMCVTWQKRPIYDERRPICCEIRPRVVKWGGSRYGCGKRAYTYVIYIYIYIHIYIYTYVYIHTTYMMYYIHTAYVMCSKLYTVYVYTVYTHTHDLYTRLLYTHDLYTYESCVYSTHVCIREVGGWGRDPKKCTGRDWGMGSSTI